MKSPRQRTDTSRRQFVQMAGAAAALSGLARPAATASARTLGANDRIGVGLIGCGGRGNNHLDHIEKIKSTGGKVEVTAVCDVYRPRLDKAAKARNARAYMDHRELLADPNVDVVAIATPDHIHGYQVIDAVRAGKDVYCEKPVTHWRQFELTRRMAAEVERSGRIFQVGTQGMSDQSWHQARKLIADGLIGQPIHAECGYFRVGDWGERGMPIDDVKAKPGPDLNWEAFLGDAPRRDFDVSRFFRWRMYEDYSGGPATDLYPHSLTPVLYMLGLKFPASVVGTGGKHRYQEREVPDTMNVLIEYPEKTTVAVLGTQGNDFFGTSEHGSPGRSPIIRGWDGTLTFRPKEIVFTPTRGSKKTEQTFPVEQGEDTVRYWEDFLSACRTRQPVAANAALALWVQTPMQMAFQGWRAGKVARFDRENQTITL